MPEIWIMSNRQPWVEAICRGFIRTKTRSIAVNLPPVGATVYLHASLSLWREWKMLEWVKEHDIDVCGLPRGCVLAVATVEKVGPTDDIMPRHDRTYFEIGSEKGWADMWSCADEQSIVFKDVRILDKPIYCKGTLVPTRKLPQELVRYIAKNGHITH